MCAAQKSRLRRADCSGQWKRRPAVRAALTTAPPHRSNPMSARTAVCSADRSAWSAGTITATLPHSAAPYPGAVSAPVAPGAMRRAPILEDNDRPARGDDLVPSGSS